MAVTPNFSIPLYTTSDTAKLDTLLNGQATALDTNLKTAIDAIPKFYRVGLDSGRTSPVGWTPAEGYKYYSTDTNIEWFHNGTAWVRGTPPTLTALTYTGIYSAGSVSPRLVEQNGRIYLQGIVQSTSASFSAGTYYVIGSIPVAKAPASTFQYAAMLNGVFGGIAIDAATGNISFFSSVAFTGVLTLHLNGASWPDKNL